MDGALQGLVNGLTNATDKQGSTAVPNPLADWCEEGHARQEWIRRDKCVTGPAGTESPSLIFLPLKQNRQN